MIFRRERKRAFQFQLNKIIKKIYSLFSERITLTKRVVQTELVKWQEENSLSLSSLDHGNVYQDFDLIKYKFYSPSPSPSTSSRLAVFGFVYANRKVDYEPR